MSLLNDALRKQRHTGASSAADTPHPMPPAMQKRKRPSAAILLAALTAGSAIAVWNYSQHFATPKSSQPGRVTLAESVPAVSPIPGTAAVVRNPSPLLTAAAETAKNSENAQTAKQAPVRRRPSASKKEAFESTAAAPPAPKPKAEPPEKTPAAVHGPAAATQTVAVEAQPAAGAVSSLMKKADFLRLQKQHEEAAALYREVLAAVPEHTAARMHLAAAYLALQRPAEAASLLQTLRAKNIDAPALWRSAAIAAIGLDRPEQALADIERLEKFPAYRFEACFYRGAALSRLKKPLEALHWYHKAAALQPNYPPLLFNTAVVYDRLGKFPEAVVQYKAFLAHSPDVPPSEKTAVQDRIRQLVRYQNAFSKRP